jgi:hypothetical protein
LKLFRELLRSLLSGATRIERIDPGVIDLGKLEPVDPKLVWQHEALEFTPWLLANAERLSEALGIDLELEAAEHRVEGTSSTSSVVTSQTMLYSSWRTN